MSRTDELKAMIRDVPDFPQPGIIFRDITPVLANRDSFHEIVEHFLYPARMNEVIRGRFEDCGLGLFSDHEPHRAVKGRFFNHNA